MTPLIAGIALGLVSSAHCVTMCGPLMLALRQQTAGRGARSALVCYHVGRIAAYAALGAAAGGIGRALATGSVGRALSIAAGLTLIAMAIGRAGGSLSTRVASFLGPKLGRASVALHRHYDRRPLLSATAAGVLNACLPCGVLYAAIAAAPLGGDAWSSALFMAAFGAGTVPLLVSAWGLTGLMSGLARARWRYAAPAVLAVVGLLLVGRGVRELHVHAAVTADTPAQHLGHHELHQHSDHERHQHPE